MKWILLLLALPAWATNAVFLADSAAGANDGTSCANAKAVAAYYNTIGNWSATPTGIQIGPDTTVHFCGTITGGVSSDLLTTQGSGTSGHPIIHKWEAGAVFTSAAWDVPISTNGQTNLVFDGNGTSPSITSTDNGQLLGHQIDSAAFYGSGCTNCEFKNLTITNMYVMTAPATSAQGFGNGIRSNGVGVSVHDCYFDQMFVGVNLPYANGDSGYNIYNNTLDHVNWGIYISGNSTATLSGALIHNNHVLNMNNWDNFPSNPYHHDGICVVQNNAGADISGTQIYNNLFDGNQGDSATAWIFWNTGIHTIYVFNNVMSCLVNCGGYGLEAGQTGDTNYYLLNNTYISAGGGAPFMNVGPIAGLFVKNNAVIEAFTNIFATTTSGTVQIDYNGYSNLTTIATGHAFKFEDPGGQTYAQYLASNPTFDLHAVTSADLLVNTTTFLPAAGSALIGAGVDLSGLGITALNSDYNGVARGSTWTIGALNAAPAGGGSSSLGAGKMLGAGTMLP